MPVDWDSKPPFDRSLLDPDSLGFKILPASARSPSPHQEGRQLDTAETSRNNLSFVAPIQLSLSHLSYQPSSCQGPEYIHCCELPEALGPTRR
jgi:hypothetical protein